MGLRRILTLIVSCLVVATALLGPRATAATLAGGPGSEVLGGTNLADTIDTGEGTNHVFARKGKDTITSSGLNDYVFLGAQADKVTAFPGGSGAFITDDDGKASRREKGDVIVGSPSADTITSADGEKDTIDCGENTDFAYVDTIDVLTDCEYRIHVTTGGHSFGTNGQDTLYGDPDHFGGLYGKAGNDQLFGSSPGEHFFGGSGTDYVFGSGGNDAIHDDDGTAGDHLRGSVGNDTIYSADGAADAVDCGEQVDWAFVDAQDNVEECETIVVVPVGGIVP